jgi:hypothetical protein
MRFTTLFTALTALALAASAPVASPDTDTLEARDLLPRQPPRHPL